MSNYRIICGDMLKVLPTVQRPVCIFADPPDNLGADYDGYDDNQSHISYYTQLANWFCACLERSPFVWFSVYYRYAPAIRSTLLDWPNAACCDIRQIIWYFTFGQHRHSDLANTYRPILRVRDVQKAPLYPDHIRVPSARQQMGDKRADPRGRVPGDVWEFPRVCGTFKERRPWIPNQHPEALVERAILLSTKPGDLVIDPFLGSGTTLRVCQRINRDCIGIDISEPYCRRVSEETGVPWSHHHEPPTNNLGGHPREATTAVPKDRPNPRDRQTGGN